MQTTLGKIKFGLDSQSCSTLLLYFRPTPSITHADTFYKSLNEFNFLSCCRTVYVFSDLVIAIVLSGYWNYKRWWNSDSVRWREFVTSSQWSGPFAYSSWSYWRILGKTFSVRSNIYRRCFWEHSDVSFHSCHVDLSSYVS